ncbi:hypothetical protein AVEN_40296-1, partial [Araneus ventricosus]
STTL